MDLPTVDVDLGPEKIEEKKEIGPLLHCDLCDIEVVHKLAQMFLPGLGSACVDNTLGGLFKTPGSVAVDLRKEMIDYLTQRSESFVAESVILEGGPDGEVSDHPFDIISNLVDDFASSKRNFLSRVSGWLLSEKREDKIDDFVQEMEMNGFWTLDRRGTIAETLLKNVDFENKFHCSMSFNSEEELANHVDNCNFRPVICENQGCNAKFCAGHLKKHDSVCPFKIISCEQKCSDSIMRRDMDRHCITVCPMKLVNCPFYAVGCRSAVAQCMIEKHRSDDVDSHLWHLLKGIHKEASGDDLKRRVEQIIQASSSSRLAAARDVRSLNFIVKDIEAKLGPFEVTVVEKNSAENDAKNDDKEESDTNVNNSEHSTQTSAAINSSDKAEATSDAVNSSDKAEAFSDAVNSSDKAEATSDAVNSSDKAEVTSDAVNSSDKAEVTSDAVNSSDKAEVNSDAVNSSDKAEVTTDAVNSLDKAEVNDISNIDSGKNTVMNEDSESIHIENKSSEERAETSSTENLSDKAEVGLVNDDSAQISELQIKGSEDSTQTDMEILSDREISATNESSSENSTKSKYIEDSNLEDKNIEHSIQNTEVETKRTTENNDKNKDIEDDNTKKSLETSNGYSEESRVAE